MKSKKTILKDFGGSGEVIILLHGFLASSQYWRRLQPHLTKAGYRVITIDLLGFGAAVNVSAHSYNYTEHIAHIRSYITSLHLQKPYNLVGHSMGALLAARYGSRYPEEIKRLLLLHPPLYKDRGEVRATLRNTNWAYRYLLDSRMRELGWKCMKYIPTLPISTHSFASREKSMKYIIEAAEFHEDLMQLQIPTTLLLGSKDRAEYIKNLSIVNTAQAVSIHILNISHHSPFFNPRTISNLIIADITDI